MAFPARANQSEEESLAALALEGIPGGVMVLDSRGQVLLASAVAVSILGGEVENVTSDTMTSEDFPRREVFKLLRGACESGSRLSRLIAFDRECRHYIQIDASPLPGWEGEKRMAVLIMDLTEAVAQGYMAKEFVRQIRHDLRGPLTSIRGAADLLMTERLGPLDAQQKKLLELVGKATHQMTAIVSGDASAPPSVSGTGPEGAQGGGK